MKLTESRSQKPVRSERNHSRQGHLFQLGHITRLHRKDLKPVPLVPLPGRAVSQLQPACTAFRTYPPKLTSLSDRKHATWSWEWRQGRAGTAKGHRELCRDGNILCLGCDGDDTGVNIS